MNVSGIRDKPVDIRFDQIAGPVVVERHDGAIVERDPFRLSEKCSANTRIRFRHCGFIAPFEMLLVVPPVVQDAAVVARKNNKERFRRIEQRPAGIGDREIGVLKVVEWVLRSDVTISA